MFDTLELKQTFDMIRYCLENLVLCIGDDFGLIYKLHQVYSKRIRDI